jgi:hypothetical protein
LVVGAKMSLDGSGFNTGIDSRKCGTKALAEKRKHNRLNSSLPLECRIQLINCQEAWLTPGMLKNISLGGLYFVCETLPFLRQGDVGDFIWNFAGDNEVCNLIRTRARVKRVEHHVRGLTDYGVAVEFLPSLATL